MSPENALMAVARKAYEDEEFYEALKRHRQHPENVLSQNGFTLSAADLETLRHAMNGELVDVRLSATLLFDIAHNVRRQRLPDDWNHWTVGFWKWQPPSQR